MALQSSGAISMAQIQTEFGGSNPISISEYYGVGTVPSSGTISMSDFYGQSNATAPSSVSITGGTVTCFVESVEGSCTASKTLSPTINGGSGGSYTYAWTQVSGTGMTETSRTGSTMTLTYNSEPPEGGYSPTRTETWKVAVTNAGGTTTSNTVSVSLRAYGDWEY
jgi:hypothetical protein